MYRFHAHSTVQFSCYFYYFKSASSVLQKQTVLTDHLESGQLLVFVFALFNFKCPTYSYAGPESQKVVSRFPMGSDMLNWLVYMGSSHKVLVAMMDGRGTRGRGEDFKRLMYRQLGTVEVEDQILGAE